MQHNPPPPPPHDTYNILTRSGRVSLSMADIYHDSEIGRTNYGNLRDFMRDVWEASPYSTAVRRTFGGHATNAFRSAQQTKVLLEDLQELRDAIAANAEEVKQLRIESERFHVETEAKFTDRDQIRDEAQSELQDNFHEMVTRVNNLERYLTYQSATDFFAIIRRQIIDAGRDCFAWGLHFFLDFFLRFFYWSKRAELRNFVVKVCFGLRPSKKPVETLPSLHERLRLERVSVAPANPAGGSSTLPTTSALAVAKHLSTSSGTEFYNADKLPVGETMNASIGKAMVAGNYFSPIFQKSSYITANDWKRWWSKAAFGSVIQFASVDRSGESSNHQTSGLSETAAAAWKHGMDHFINLMSGKPVERKQPGGASSGEFDQVAFLDEAQRIVNHLEQKLSQEQRQIVLSHVCFARGMLDDLDTTCAVLAMSDDLRDIGSGAAHTVSLPLKLEAEKESAWVAAINETEGVPVPDREVKKLGMLNIFTLMKQSA